MYREKLEEISKMKLRAIEVFEKINYFRVK